MVQRTVPERTDHECLLYDTDHCLCLSGDRNDHRNGSSNRHSGNEAEMEDHVHGSYQHPDDECRDRYGCVIDASLYCFSHDTWFRHHPDRAYYVQYSVCDPECVTEAETDKPLYI